MYVRVPKFRQQTNEAMELLLKPYLQQLGSNPEAFERAKARYKEKTGEDLGQLTPADLDPAKYRIELTQPHHLRTMISLAQSFIPVFHDMSWTFLHCSPSHWFITSDRPVAVYNRNDDPNSFFRPGLVDSATEISLPLTKHMCLFMTWRDGAVDHQEAPETYVEELNRNRIGYADRVILSPRDQFLGEQYLQYKGSE